MKNNSPRTGSIIFLLERTLYKLRHALHVQLRTSGVHLSIDQWIILQQLNETEISQKEISELTAKDPASVTRILAVMEKKKMVKRHGDRNDKRRVLVALTPVGKSSLQKANEAVERYRAKGMKGVEREELTALKKTLDKLYENAGGKVVM